MSYASNDKKAPTQQKNITKVASMVASPSSCVLKARAEYCQMDFYLLWQTPQTGDFCLHSKKSTKPLKCWYQQDHGSIKLKFFEHLLTNNEHYYLLDAKGDKLIAEVNIPITATLNQRQRAQRKRRGFWRMF